MRDDRTIGERITDAGEFVFGLLFMLAVVGTAIWAVAYCVKNHITVRDIGNTVISWVADGKGDETGYIQAMRTAGWNDDANVALDAGHRICGHLRTDNATPTEAVNDLTANMGSAIDPAILRKMAFTMVTNAQVYLCPDTLHNTGTPTPTTVTVTSTAPVPTATRAPTAPPMMVTAPPYYCGQYPSGTGCPEITPTPPPHQPDWKQYCATHVDRTECDNAPPMNAPTTTVPPTLVATTEETP
jgi:hypothetical protein